MLNRLIRNWIAKHEELLRDFDANHNAQIDFAEQAAIDQALRQYLFFLTEPERQWYLARGGEVSGPFPVTDPAFLAQLNGEVFLMESETHKWVPAALLLLYLRERGGKSLHPEMLAAIPFFAPVVGEAARQAGRQGRPELAHCCRFHPKQPGAKRCEMCATYFCLECIPAQFAGGAIICKFCQAEAARLQPFKQDHKVRPLSQIKLAGFIPITEGRIPFVLILGALVMVALFGPWQLPPGPPRIYGFAVALAVSATLFVFGRKITSFMALIEDTPTSKVQSAAMGRIELKGQSESPFLLTSPCFQRPCIAYHYIKEEYQRHHARGRYGQTAAAGGNWRVVQTRSRSVAFYLNDATGKALVEPDGAYIDFERTRVETRGDERYTESLLPADSDLYLLGYLRPLEKQSPFADGSVDKEVYLGPTTDKQLFLISSRTEAELLSHLWQLARLSSWGGAVVLLANLYGVITSAW